MGNGFEPSPPWDKNRFKIPCREIAELLGQRLTLGTRDVRVVRRSAGCLPKQSCPSVTSKKRFLVLRSPCNAQLLCALGKATQATPPSIQRAPAQLSFTFSSHHCPCVGLLGWLLQQPEM